MTSTAGRALLVACVLALAACAKSEPTQRAAVNVTLAPATVFTPGAALELTAAQEDAVTEALAAYITSATADPLHSGTIGDGLGRVFDPGTLAAVTGPDRAALLDEGLPTGTSTIAPVTATVNALGGPDAAVAVIATTMTVDARVDTGDGPIEVRRTATFGFYPEGDTWKVRTYDVTVNRTLPGAGTTTTGAVR